MTFSRLDTAPEYPSGFSKGKVAAGFNHAAADYNKRALVQQQIAKRSIAEFAKLHSNTQGMQKVNTLVDLGCGTAQALIELSPYCDHYVGLDISLNMLAQCTVPEQHKRTFLNADAEHLPFQNNSVGAFYSSMALQWCMSPQLLLSEVHRTLRNNGNAMLAIMVDGSFEGLHEAWQSLGLPSRVNRFLPASAWQNEAAKLPWKITTVQHSFVTYHPNLLNLLGSIKSVGANTKDSIARNTQKEREFMGKREIRAIETHLLAASKRQNASALSSSDTYENPLALTYQILFLGLQK